MDARYYSTKAGRAPALDFISSLPGRFRGQILADISVLARDGENAPVSKKSIKGHRPMWELRIGGYRVFFVRKGNTFWILGAAKKQDQDREIAASSKRMSEILGE